MKTKADVPVFLSSSIFKKRLFISINNMMRHMKCIQFGVLIQCAQLKLIYFASYQMKRFLYNYIAPPNRANSYP